jgi:hypothetical protein
VQASDAVAQQPATAPVARGDDLCRDRNRRLFGTMRADIEADRGVQTGKPMLRDSRFS